MRDDDNGRTARMNATPTTVSTAATAASPTETASPIRIDPACQLAITTSATSSAASAPQPTQSRPPARTESRSSSDGFTRRTSSSGTAENSTAISSPMAMPCTTADPVMSVDTLATPGCPAKNPGRTASPAAASPTPSTQPTAPSRMACAR